MAPSSLAELQACKYAELRSLCKVSKVFPLFTEERTLTSPLIQQTNSLKASGKTDALLAQLVDFYGL
jgi:hypothetical protein